MADKRARGLVVGRFGGAPIIVQPGWLAATVVLALGSAPLARRVLPDVTDAGAYVVGAGFGLLLLGSVLVHEVAHAWVARRRGLAVHQIVLTLVGGHTEMSDSGSPGTSALVAVAGPLANLVLGGAGWVLTMLTADAAPGGGAAVLHAGAAVLAGSNLLVAGFNLLPALPMDGGWVLEALVWRVTGRRNTGTRIGAVVGRVLAVGLLVVAVVLPIARGVAPSTTATIWSAVIGVTLWLGAGDFLRVADWRDRAEGVDLRALSTPAVAVHAGARLDDLPPAVLSGGAEAVVVGPDGAVLGYVDRVALAEVPAAHRAGVPVSAVLVPLPPAGVLDGTRRGGDAVADVGAAMRYAPTMVVMVDGAVVGLLRYTDVVHALAARPGPRGS